MAGGGSKGGMIAAQFLSVALILLSAAISHRVMLHRGGKAPAGNPPSLLEAVSRRAEFSFGFRNLFGDVVWLEAVQVAGNRKMTRSDYDRLSSLLSTTIRFDPRFTIPYLLGGVVLGDSRNHSADAIDFLRRGEERFPAEWRFPFYTSYIRYFSLGDPVGGGTALLRAARIPGSPGYFPLLASRMLSEGNQPETALAFLQEMVRGETDPRRRASLEERVRRVEVERDLQQLEAAAAEYAKKTGTGPRELGDLVRAGFLRRIPEEPYGGRYLLGADGQIRSDRAPRERLKVIRIR